MNNEPLRRALLIACYRIFDSLKDSTAANINSDAYKSFGYELKATYKNKEYSLMFYFKDIDKCSINDCEIEQFVNVYMEDVANE